VPEKYELDAREADLRTRLIAAGCEVPESGSPAETQATRMWNGALDRRPALVARCRTADQVGTALRAATNICLPLCIHNGGQDWNGRSLQDGALVLDVSGMAAVSVDPGRREAVIGAGVTSGRLNQAAAEHGLAPVIGNDGAVSMVGLMLGGGYGPLMTRLGLACDNLLSAGVVTPDGEAVTCDPDIRPDLFWALRGGGGGFGVVTAASVRLHALEPPLAGAVVFPWPDARAALARFGELMLRAPAELFAAAVLSLGPGGRPAAVISLVWTGEEARGREIVDDIASAGSPVVIRVESTPASALLAATDGKLAPGLGYEVATRWLDVLAPEATDALVTAFEARTSPLSSIIVHHCHGAATEVAPEATAFGMRRPHFTALVYGAWSPADGDGPHRLWAPGTAEALDSVALPGAYATLLADGDGRAGHAYGPNGPRLAEIKRRMDPAGVLRALPLPL
jgi:FAD/FMN-containing dehydrogenase